MARPAKLRKRLKAELRALRSRKQWTQEELARAIGAGSIMVSRWEREVSWPAEAHWCALAKLGIPAWLLVPPGLLSEAA